MRKLLLLILFLWVSTLGVSAYNVGSPSNTSTAQVVPTPTADLPIVAPNVSPSTFLGLSYAIIAPGDFEGLKIAVSFGNGLAAQPPAYIIYLHSGTYVFTETLVITGNIQILGRGEHLTFLVQAPNSPMRGLFTLPGQSLHLDNVHLQNGNSDVWNVGKGGAVWVQSYTAISQLTVTNSRFSNNYAHYGGAIAVDQGYVVIENSTFRENWSQYGGVIYSTSPFPRSVDARCVDFQGNYALTSPGGVLFNASMVGTFRIVNSNFRSSSAFGSQPPMLDPIHLHVYTVNFSTVSINASRNFWSNPSVISSSLLYGIKTDAQIARVSCPRLIPMPISSLSQ